MGSRGPAGKRSDQQMGHRTEAEKSAVTKVAMSGTVEAPPLGLEDAHELVTSLYHSLTESGQARFYEPSDWQYARVIMSQLNDYLQQEKKSPTMFGEIMSALTSLMLTEGDRRRLKMEIDRSDNSEQEAKEKEDRMSHLRLLAGGQS